MTRASLLLWSAASGFVVGLLGGVGLLALLTLAVNLLPVSERFVDRMRTPAILVLLLLVPLLGAVVGYLEGRGKLS